MPESFGEKEIAELGKIFPADSTTRSLLRSAGFEARSLPAIVAGQTPDDFWNLINEWIEDGRLPPDSRERILGLARRKARYNPVLFGPPVPRPWRVLLLGASPVVPVAGGRSLGEVEASLEYREILNACDPRRAELDVRYVPYATVADFAHLADWRPHLLHLACHGDNGSLVLHERAAGPEGNHQAPRVIPVEDLAGLLAAYVQHAKIRLAGIVINACRSGPAADVLAEHADVVVAHGDDLPSGSAIAFTRALYPSLRRLATLDAAVKVAIAHLTAADKDAHRITDGLVIRQR